jgi:hypothetical protein
MNYVQNTSSLEASLRITIHAGETPGGDILESNIPFIADG